MFKQVNNRRAQVLLLMCLATSGCITSPGNTSVLIGVGDAYKPSGEEEVVRGVVNGLYEFDPEKTLAALKKYDEHLSPEEMAEISQMYIVRVGLDRVSALYAISPIKIGAKWIDYVVLPRGWTHSPGEISDEPRVINVGDIIDVVVEKGRRYDFALDLVRKCTEPPAEDENPDWDIGCKTYDGYNDWGYAGEQYVFRAF